MPATPSPPGASRPIRIAVDCMGGDHGPAVTLPACKAFLASHRDAELILVGREAALAPAVGWPRCTAVVAAEVVEMTDPIEVALRKKKDSSLRVAVSQVKPRGDGSTAADACVSAGNTGALLAVSRYVLKTIDGIDRPAIATLLPNQKDGYTTVLDLGANVDCTAEHLLQFAVMGSAFVSAIGGERRDEPSVGLLNIGEEAIKGGETIKEAGELLRAAGAAGLVRFFGNVEGNDIFKGTTEIVVCDGFVGNVALKTAEGAAALLMDFMKREFSRNALTKLGALAALPALKRLKKRVDHRRYNGAPLLGLRGLVFKSHGSADAFAFEQALGRAHAAARSALVQRVEQRIRATLDALPAKMPAGDAAPSANPARPMPALSGA